MTFRRRIIVAMVPLFALLVALGGTGTVLIYQLGKRINESLRENYDSVIYMRDLNEALEGIDSSFRFALAGREEESYRQFQANGRLYDAALSKEQHNITVPGERELVDTLTALSDHYRRQGEDFFKMRRPKAGHALPARAELAGALRQIPRHQDRFERDPADQPGPHGRGQPAGAPLGPFLAPLVWRRLGDRNRPGHIPRRQHDPHGLAPDSRRHRIGRSHRRRRPGSARTRLVRG